MAGGGTKLLNLPVVLKALDRLELDIRRAPSFAVLTALGDIAARMQQRYRPEKEVANRAGKCWNEVEHKIGEELDKVPKATGRRGQIVGRKVGSGGRGKRANLSSGGTKLAAPDETPADRDRGISKRQAARARKLFEIGREARQALEVELAELDKAITPNAVLALQRTKNKQRRKAEIAAARFSADGPFDVVVIDPPWQVEKIDRELFLNQDAFDYPTMSTEQIAEFWRRDLAPRLNPDVHVFLWTTNRYLPAAIDLLKPLGLRYTLTMVWHKPGGFQPIELPQFNCEFIVYARLGSPVFIDTKAFNCCFSAPRREHSRKPDEFYDTIRRVTGGSRIDVFSRELREGFAQYGNEPDRFGPKEAAE